MYDICIYKGDQYLYRKNGVTVFLYLNDKDRIEHNWIHCADLKSLKFEKVKIFNPMPAFSFSENMGRDSDESKTLVKSFDKLRN